jgi:glucose-6-phosphate-specific signal transduction histidine kinase
MGLVQGETGQQNNRGLHRAATTDALGQRITDQPGLDMNLAAYRIVEQAVLNSAVHGQAAHVTVQIRVDTQHMSTEVVDDGSAIPSNFVPGTGHFVTDSWVSSLGGIWNREPGEHGVPR